MSVNNPVLRRPCPECGQPLRFERGYPPSRTDPGHPDGAYCEECGHTEQPTADDFEQLEPGFPDDTLTDVEADAMTLEGVYGPEE